jgi:hypothetical protein
MTERKLQNIPYERQSDAKTCGASALCMVYRSFGLACTQAEVWSKVSLGNTAPRGAPSYALAQDAIQRGLSALMIRARNPFQILKRCEAAAIPAILNHRARIELPTGHYTVFIELADDHVTLHDPQLGAFTRLAPTDLLKLWLPYGAPSEITGNVLIAFGKGSRSTPPCPRCGSRLPAAVSCPSCLKMISLQPGAVLACGDSTCPERAWELVYCPFCECGLRDVTGKATDFVPGRLAEGDSAASLDIKKAFVALDAFCSMLVQNHGGTPPPNIQVHLDAVKSSRAQLLEWQVKEAAEQKARKAAARAAQPPAAKAAETPAKAPEPLDANALGWQMVKEFGFVPVAPPVAKEPVPSPAKKEPAPSKKEPAKVTDHELVRKAMKKPAKPPSDEDFGSLRLG